MTCACCGSERVPSTAKYRPYCVRCWVRTRYGHPCYCWNQMLVDADRNCERKMALLQGFKCSIHGQDRPWMICTHVVEDTAPACSRRIEEDGVAGEVMCAVCLAHVEAGNPELAELRLACERCVLERWPLDDAS